MATYRLARTAVALAAIGAAMLLAGLVAAYFQRSAEGLSGVAPLATGTVLCLGSAGVGIAAARSPAGLSWPDELAGSWPMSPWWWVVGAAGVVDVLAGPLVSGWLGAVGVLLVGAACVGLGRDLVAPPALVSRSTVRAAQRLRTASAASAEPTAALSRIGTGGARLVVFEESGRLADVVVSDPATGELAASLAGIRLVPPSDLHPPLRTG